MCSEQVDSARPSRDVLKKRSGTSAPISLEDLMEKEVQSSSQDGTIREPTTPGLSDGPSFRRVQSNPLECHGQKSPRDQVIGMVTDHTSDKIQKPLT